MSGFRMENLIPVGDSSWLSPSCRRCKDRKDCPYVYEQNLDRAARQGRRTAQQLTEEAEQLLETLSRSGDLCVLLDGDRALERVLSQALDSELDLIRSLRAQAEKDCP